MATTKIFMSGNSQAVRIPKEFKLDGNEVEIFRQDEDLILRKKKVNLAEAFEILTSMPSDFFAKGREDLPAQERETL